MGQYRQLEGKADPEVVRAIRELTDKLYTLHSDVQDTKTNVSKIPPSAFSVQPTLEAQGLNLVLHQPLQISSGTGTPEGAVNGSIGDFYMRQIDGTPGAAVYVKESGQSTRTGWSSVATAAGGQLVTSVFSRTGIVTAQTGDYTFAQISGTLTLVGLPVYANNAAAILGGLVAGGLYRTGGDPSIVCVVF